MARTGMTALLEELRGMIEAGTADYTVGTTSYWADNALQDVLDSHRQDIVHEQLYPAHVIGTGGTALYYDYRSRYRFFEASSGGTSIFYIQDSGGTTQGTAAYTPDYRRGLVTFGTDTAGSVMFLTGRSYDLNAAAAEIWRKKAAHYAPTSFNFSTDNHSISREQVYSHCQEMASFFSGISQDAFGSTEMIRSDM